MSELSGEISGEVLPNPEALKGWLKSNYPDVFKKTKSRNIKKFVNRLKRNNSAIYWGFMSWATEKEESKNLKDTANFFVTAANLG